MKIHPLNYSRDVILQEAFNLKLVQFQQPALPYLLIQPRCLVITKTKVIMQKNIIKYMTS